MERKELGAAIEAILFTMGEAVEADRIATALSVDVEVVREVVRGMMQRYEREEHGIQIIELEDAFQMCTKASMYEHLIKIAHVPKKQNLFLLMFYLRRFPLSRTSSRSQSRKLRRSAG